MVVRTPAQAPEHAALVAEPERRRVIAEARRDDARDLRRYVGPDHGDLTALRLDEAQQIAALERVVAALHHLGHRHILCEGGPRLNAQLVAAGLVDELCLTISPMLVGGSAARILDGTSSPTGLRLAHVLEDDGFLFCRYVRPD